MTISEALKDNPVDDTEDCGSRADSKHQRQNNSYRKDTISLETA